MTQEQKAQLLLAIDRAEGPGACSYKAGCVIAQLADIVDPSGETRSRLERFDSHGIDQHMSGVVAPREPLILPGFNSAAQLRGIQGRWDSATPETVAEARAKMRALVEAA